MTIKTLYVNEKTTNNEKRCMYMCFQRRFYFPFGSGGWWSGKMGKGKG